MLSIGCFIGNDAGLEYVNKVGKDYPIHVGFFKVSEFDRYAHHIEQGVKISSCHLPCWFSGDWLDLQRVIQWCEDRIEEDQLRLVLHPNNRVYTAVKQMMKEEYRYYYKYNSATEYMWNDHIFCLENFPWKVRHKKIFVTPMEILIHNAGYKHHTRYHEREDKFYPQMGARFGLCLDVAHLDLQWFTPSMLYPIIDEAEIIHFSNQDRKTKKHHLPWEEGHAPLKMVLDYIKKHDLHPEIVFEYMVEFKEAGRCEQDLEFVKKYLGWT